MHLPNLPVRLPLVPAHTHLPSYLCASSLASRHACLHHTQLTCARSAPSALPMRAPYLHTHMCTQASYLPSARPGAQVHELARMCA
ncbi:hypothetical protein FIBSPDRAFT_847114 [Athelia psychrophila]|uniref:Uncharacterized protein n=1 Tax=Athelia psychrophila TaxID=1759441 RepID=A0A166WQ03_9AGAM|nr:hypothetical protein FIBSPDRAFT_847114 [Fibularhizoctonia sp. CBS 109695]